MNSESNKDCKINKKDIFIFGMILEGDIYVDGYGTTEEDNEMLQRALHKVYGVDENSTKEQLKELDKQFKKDVLKFIEEYREKIKRMI